MLRARGYAMVDYGYFQKSLKNLELQNDNRKNLPPELPRLMLEAVDESVIRRFGICYDTLWKSLRRHLIDVAGLPEVAASPRAVFRLAGEIETFDSPVERWMEYANLRIGIGQDYGREKAAAALEGVDDFIADAIGLYRTLTGEVWE